MSYAHPRRSLRGKYAVLVGEVPFDLATEARRSDQAWQTFHNGKLSGNRGTLPGSKRVGGWFLPLTIDHRLSTIDRITDDRHRPKSPVRNLNRETALLAATSAWLRRFQINADMAATRTTLHPAFRTGLLHSSPGNLNSFRRGWMRTV